MSFYHNYYLALAKLRENLKTKSRGDYNIIVNQKQVLFLDCMTIDRWEGSCSRSRTTTSLCNVPPVSSPDANSEEEGDPIPGTSGQWVRGLWETQTRGQRDPAWQSNCSQNDWMGSQLSPSSMSHSCNKLAWRLQESEGSCQWPVRMRKWSQPPPHLIQERTGRRGARNSTGRPGYLQGGSLTYHEGLYLTTVPCLVDYF